jgi:phospholipid/cholesterol/gamma-HCH transport system ATP-binding protein
MSTREPGRGETPRRDPAGAEEALRERAQGAPDGGGQGSTQAPIAPMTPAAPGAPAAPATGDGAGVQTERAPVAREGVATADDDGRWSIRCFDVHKRLGGVPVLDGVNLDIPDEMITVLLGPSGTGKSVMIKHLIGLMFPDSGDIVVHGQSVPHLPMPDLLRLRRRIGVLFQDGALFGSMSLYDNVAFPLRQHTDRTEGEIEKIVKERLSDVGLGNFENLFPNELSGGMRKRAGFARALAMEPDVVIFDEPDSGLDPVRTALLCELIREMHATYGGTYLVVTHDIASARRIGEYIAVLWKGRIVQSGDAAEMCASENPFVQQFLSGSARGPLGMD